MIKRTTNTFEQKKIASEDTYVRMLKKLEERIEEISKNITYLDVYNIIDTVESKDELNIKTAGLVNNSSLVINCPNFQEGSESYTTGDIVLKDNTGNLIHIEAQPGGVYYPIGITTDDINSNNYTITYKYDTSTPTTGSTYPKDDQETSPPTGPRETMSFSVNVTSGDEFIYGIWEKYESDDENSPYKFNAYSNVQPQIQIWFGKEDNPVEQIYCDFVLTLQGNEYILENIPTNTWIKVK